MIRKEILELPFPPYLLRQTCSLGTFVKDMTLVAYVVFLHDILQMDLTDPIREEERTSPAAESFTADSGQS